MAQNATKKKETLIDSLVEMVSDILKRKQKYIKLRLEIFQEVYQRTYGRDILLDPSKQMNYLEGYSRGVSDAVQEAFPFLLFHTTLALYALGFEMAAMIELSGTLERNAIYWLEQYLSLEREHRVTETLLNSKTLPDLAEILASLGVWDRDQVKIAKQINAIRNGSAHKNPKFAEKRIGGKSRMSFFGMSGPFYPIVTGPEALKYIILSVPLLTRLGTFGMLSVHLSKRRKSKNDKVLIARLIRSFELPEKSQYVEF